MYTYRSRGIDTIEAVFVSRLIEATIIVSVLPTIPPIGSSLPRSKIFVTSEGTSNRGTAVGIGVGGVAVKNRFGVPYAGTKGFSWGTLVGVGVDVGASVGVADGSGVFVGVLLGPGDGVNVSVGIGVKVGGSGVAVAVSVSVAALAMLVGALPT
jgi:hypothetical protein